MSGRALLDQYAGTAGRLGTIVKILRRDALRESLAAMLTETGVKKAVLSKAGWPPGLLGTLEDALAGSGVATMSPVETGPGVFVLDRKDFDDAELGISFCEHFLADPGAMAFTSGPGAFTASSLIAPVHLSVSLSTGVLSGFGELLAKTGRDMPSRLVLVAGPSRTGDIEASMTTCVHGPGRVHHWIIED